jgi:hypothetical protein
MDTIEPSRSDLHDDPEEAERLKLRRAIDRFVTMERAQEERSERVRRRREEERGEERRLIGERAECRIAALAFHARALPDHGDSGARG